MTVRLFAGAAVLASIPALPCYAQNIGIGGRFSMVRGDVATDTSA